MFARAFTNTRGGVEREAAGPPAPADADPAAPADADPVTRGQAMSDSVVVPVAEDLGRWPELGPEETVEGIPVLAEVRAIEPFSPVSLPAVQAAAVAATGFVAGAATLALVRRHSARKLARRRRQQRPGLDALTVVASRSFLVDVHLIAKPGE